MNEGEVSGNVFATAKNQYPAPSLATVTITLTNAEGETVPPPRVAYVDLDNNQVRFVLPIPAPGFYTVTARFKQSGVRVTGLAKEWPQPIEVPEAKKNANSKPSPNLTPGGLRTWPTFYA